MPWADQESQDTPVAEPFIPFRATRVLANVPFGLAGPVFSPLRSIVSSRILASRCLFSALSKYISARVVYDADHVIQENDTVAKPIPRFFLGPVYLSSQVPNSANEPGREMSAVISYGGREG